MEQVVWYGLYGMETKARSLVGYMVCSNHPKVLGFVGSNHKLNVVCNKLNEVLRLTNSKNVQK